MTEIADIVEDALLQKDTATAVNAWVAFNDLPRGDEAALTDPDKAAITAVTADGISGHLGITEPGQRCILLVNGHVINTTHASQPRDNAAAAPSNGFRFPMASLWNFLGTDDVLEVHDADGKPLTFANGRAGFRIHARRQSRVPRLLRKLKKGAVISKKGRLVEAFNSDSAHVQSCMDTFYTAHGILLKDCSRKLFPICGTLLGAVRDKDFIRGDTDIDTTFVSPYTEPDAVKADYLQVAKALRRAGYRIAIAASGMRVFSTEGSTRKAFSIMMSWRRADDRFEMSYGRMGELPLVDWPMKFIVGRIGTFAIDIPAESEALLHMSYGAGWRIPDPGFSHEGRTPGNPDFLFSSEEKLAMEQELGAL